jgi:hypothetical protein
MRVYSQLADAPYPFTFTVFFVPPSPSAPLLSPIYPSAHRPIYPPPICNTETFIDLRSFSFLRVTSNASDECPDSLFDYDAGYFRNAFHSLMTNLSVPVIRVWEDGEIMGGEMESSSKHGYLADPGGA